MNTSGLQQATEAVCCEYYNDTSAPVNSDNFKHWLKIVLFHAKKIGTVLIFALNGETNLLFIILTCKTWKLTCTPVLQYLFSE